LDQAATLATDHLPFRRSQVRSAECGVLRTSDDFNADGSSRHIVRASRRSSPKPSSHKSEHLPRELFERPAGGVDACDTFLPMDRDSAFALLREYTHNESLVKHALAVEACMRAYARQFDPANEDVWGIVGLLHDFDYDMFPTKEEHPYVGEKILEDRGYPPEVRRAILSHAEYTGVSRETPMEKTLFACDELAGFLTACALVKPNKSIFEVEAPSVKKKMKDKAFARSVNRDDITKGAADLGVDLERHIAFCIEALRSVAGDLGLAG